MTLLAAIIQSLSRAGEYHRDDQVAPERQTGMPNISASSWGEAADSSFAGL
jgi:hypothetical protein